MIHNKPSFAPALLAAVVACVPAAGQCAATWSPKFADPAAYYTRGICVY